MLPLKPDHLPVIKTASKRLHLNLKFLKTYISPACSIMLVNHDEPEHHKKTSVILCYRGWNRTRFDKKIIKDLFLYTCELSQSLTLFLNRFPIHDMCIFFAFLPSREL